MRTAETCALIPILWINKQIELCKERISWTSDEKIKDIYQTKIDVFKELLRFEKLTTYENT